MGTKSQRGGSSPGLTRADLNRRLRTLRDRVLEGQWAPGAAVADRGWHVRKEVPFPTLVRRVLREEELDLITRHEAQKQMMVALARVQPLRQYEVGGKEKVGKAVEEAIR